MMESDPIVQNKAAYLNMPFLVTRNVVVLVGLLFGMALYFVYHAAAPRHGALTEEAAGGRRVTFRLA